MQQRTLGILFIAVPLPLLFVTLSLYAVSSFVISSFAATDGGSQDTLVTVASLINMLLGLLGFVSVIGILVGIPLGIYLIVTADKNKTTPIAQQPSIAPPQV